MKVNLISYRAEASEPSVVSAPNWGSNEDGRGFYRLACLGKWTHLIPEYALPLPPPCLLNDAVGCCVVTAVVSCRDWP